MTKNRVEQELKMRYLYAELTDEEKERLEELFFLDDELFFEVAELENELVDQYAKGELSAEDTLRFEKSLKQFPERKKNLTYARTLQTYLQEEKPTTVEPKIIAPVEQSTVWQRLSNFLTFQSPLLSSAMAGLLLIFMIAGLVLFLDNRRKSAELARLQNERAGIEGTWQQRENELKEQISSSKQRLEDLKNQLENKDEDAADLIKTLNREQQKNQQLETDLDKLRQDKNKPGPTPKSAGPTIASIILSNRGNNGGKFNTTSVGANTTKLAINLTLPEQVKKDDILFLQLNGNPFMQNVSPVNKSLSLTIPIKILNPGTNKLTVFNQENKVIINYTFNLEKPNN